MMAEEDSKPNPVSDREMEIVFSGPALLSNKVYATGLSTGVRLAFCEIRSGDTEPVFRSAIFIAYPDVPAFIKVLQRAMERVEMQFVEAPKENEEGGGG